MPQNRHLQHNSDRRFRVFSRMGQSGACLIPSKPLVLRNGDAHFPYRQDSNFYYLTGFEEDGAILLLLSKDNQHRTILFCLESTKHEARWMGARAGVNGALNDFGVDEAYCIDDIDAHLPTLLSNVDTLYYPIHQDQEFEAHLHQTLAKVQANKRMGWSAPRQHVDISALMDELRLFKMGDEIARMRKAASISALAHAEAMKACKPEMMEYELESHYVSNYMKHGARHCAYESIVASGPNACILHYTKNNRKMLDGELVLVDSGCEYQGYASDITRTFPVNGRFTPEQKDVYTIVLEAQLAAIDKAKAGVAWDQMQKVIVERITQGLVDLGILTGSVPDLIEQKAYQDYYMHQSGHWLGLDVHDVGDYRIDGVWRDLKQGMVLTIEPGLYLPHDDMSLDEKWRGIGVRIEDDVLITDGDCDLLTQQVPKSIDEIEALMNE